jgi:zinc transport system substrate-binding protein
MLKAYRRALAAALAGLIAAAAVAMGLAGGASAEVRVVVSIKPLHGLVAAVMAGTGEPHLIVEGGNSPHTFALKPSDAAALQDADVVFWMGDGLEGFLARPLEALAGGARLVALAQAPGLVRYAVRQGGPWVPDSDEGEAGGTADMHMWLDPVNAAAMAEAIAAALGAADGANAGLYGANTQRLKDRLAALTAEMEAALAPVKGRPFIVFHDGYQYLEKRFGLNAAGSITINPEVAPGAKRVAEIRARMLDLGVACIFAEPQFAPAIIAAVAEGTGARSAILDPLGADLPKGPDLYIDLMRRNLTALVGCLGG